MGLKSQNSLLSSEQLEKLVKRLSKPAERTKEALKVKLLKSVDRFKAEVKKEETDTKKALLLKRLGKIKADLKLLKELSVETIIRYALSTDKNLMAVAANKRLPNDVRMKARISSHKPLSSRISQLRRNQQSDSDSSDDSKQEEDEEDDSKNKSGLKLDKMTLNNQVVLMRKDTRRAVVHTINKWTKSIKKLRGSKAVGNKKTLFEAKAEKFVKKIKYVKEYEVDEISKFALSNAQPVQNILSDPKIPLKTQAIATVATNRFVQSNVEEFRKKFPDSMKTVQALLKQKKKRKLNLDIKDTNKAATLKGKSTDSECEDLDSGNEDVDEEASVDEDASEHDDSVTNSNDEVSMNEESEAESGGEDRIQSESESGDEERLQSKSESGDEDKLQSEPSDIETDEESVAEKKIDSSTKTKGPRTSIGETTSKSTTSLPKKMKLNSDVSGSETQRQKPPSQKTQPKVVDSFFVTTTNEEYLTSQVPVEISGNYNKSKWNNRNDDYIPTKEKSFSNLKNNRWKNKGTSEKWSKTGDFGKNQFQKPFSNNFENTSTNERRPLVLGNRKERRKALQEPIQEVKPEKLHPSWEAKKKVPSIASFQGKKITFD